MQHRLILPAVLLTITSLAGSGCRPSSSIGDHRSDDARSALADSVEVNIGSPGYNVLLVSVDTTRADHLACYGHPQAKTPNIDQFAAEGTRFAQCIASAPLTLPSHASMLTGSFPFVHGARDNGLFTLSGNNVTLAEIFRDAGYATHGEVAAAVLDRKYGLNQGFDTFGDVEEKEIAPPSRSEGDDALEDDPEIESERIESQNERKADEITRRGIELLTEKADANESFFMFLHYFDPHFPLEAPERFNSLNDAYLSEIAFFDEQFGKLIQSLKDLGLDEKTLVVLTADHGEGRGDHGEYTHSMFVYDSTLHVPLAMRCPGQIPAGQVVETQVRTVDIASTIVDFVGLPTTPQMQGSSLLPIIANPTMKLRLPCYADTMVPLHNLNYSPLRALRVDGWKFILAPRSELYHVAEDRQELFNVIMNEPQRAARMKAELRALIADSDPPVAGRGAVLPDQKEAQKLAALGYVVSANTSRTDSGNELDHFEPRGVNPRDRIESVECWATGLGSFVHGRFETAERLYRRFVELEPENATGFSYLAKCLLSLERPDEAIDWFRRAIELQPDRAEDHRIVGTLLFKRGERAEAEKHYLDAIKYNPEEVVARVNLGIILLAKRQFDRALNLFNEALEIQPEGPQSHFRKGIALRQMRRIDEAIESFNEALRLNPELVSAHGQRAATLHEMGETDQAIERLETAIQSLPDEPLLHHRLAEIQMATEDFEAAERGFTRVVEFLPESSIAERNLGANYLKLGNHSAAIQHLRKAIELKPDAILALHYLANALETAGEFDEAVQTYDQLFQVGPKYAPAYIPAATLMVGQGDAAGAIELLRQGIQLMPKSVSLVNALAWQLATSPRSELRDGSEAVVLAKRATELSVTPGALLLDTLAAAYAEAGRFEEAVATADRALDTIGPSHDAGLADRIRARRAKYKQGEPFHEN